MNGSTNVNAAGRSHYASAIPVPRSFSPSRMQSMAASPKLPQRHTSPSPATSSLIYNSQKATSPRPVKARTNPNGLPPKNPTPKGPSRPSVAANEKRTTVLEKADLAQGKPAVIGEGIPSPAGGSPWSSPRMVPKNLSKTREALNKSLAYGSEKDNEKESHQKPGETPGSNANKMCFGKSSTISNPAGETSQLPAKTSTRFSLYTEAVLQGSIEALKAKRPQSCPVKGQWVSEANWKTQEVPRVVPTGERGPTTVPGSGFSQANCHPPSSKGVILNSGTINFSSVMPQTPPVTATVAPFQYRLKQGECDENDSSDGDCDDSFTISDMTELSYTELAFRAHLIRIEDRVKMYVRRRRP